MLASILNRIIWIGIQSNLCTTTTLGTPKSGRCSEVVIIQRFCLYNEYSFGLLGDQVGRCWQVLIVWRWPLGQVWLYFEKLLSSDKSKKYGKIGCFGATYLNNTSYSNQSLLSLKKSMSKLPLEFFLNLQWTQFVRVDFQVKFRYSI